MTTGIFNASSYQEIATPPGKAIHHVSKAGISLSTEAPAHELRNPEGT